MQVKKTQKNGRAIEFPGAKYQNLPSDIQVKSDLYELTAVIIEESIKIEVRALFLRLQEEGTQYNRKMQWHYWQYEKFYC